MRLLWILLWFLVFASAVSLVSHANSRALLECTSQQASRAVRPAIVAQLSQSCSSLTLAVLRGLPMALRQKLSPKLIGTVQVVIFRTLLLWHAVPSLLLMFMTGVAEGLAARKGQQALVKIHSPMWFSVALTGLALLPIAALLWLTAQFAVPPGLLVLFAFSLCLFSFRHLIVHAPSEF